MVHLKPVILTAFALAENALVYNFIQRLVAAKCDCSKDWRREAIALFTMFNFIVILIKLYSDMVGDKKPNSYVLFMFLYSLSYITIVFTYSRKLRSKDCPCAEGKDADIIYYMRALDVLLMSIVLTALAYLLLFGNIETLKR